MPGLGHNEAVGWKWKQKLPNSLAVADPKEQEAKLISLRYLHIKSKTQLRIMTEQSQYTLQEFKENNT